MKVAIIVKIRGIAPRNPSSSTPSCAMALMFLPTGEPWNQCGPSLVPVCSLTSQWHSLPWSEYPSTLVNSSCQKILFRRGRERLKVCPSTDSFLKGLQQPRAAAHHGPHAGERLSILQALPHHLCEGYRTPSLLYTSLSLYCRFL